MIYPVFPKHDRGLLPRPSGHYMAAAVCRRGHVVTACIDRNESYPANTNCAECGAPVLLGCEHCGQRIRGDFIQILSVRKQTRSSFCDGCGAAHPWATRSERILELENILDQRDIGEMDRDFIRDRLRVLSAAEAIDEKFERRLWSQIADRSRSFITSEPAREIVGSLMSDVLRGQLGL
jgi:hypothetical protein